MPAAGRAPFPEPSAETGDPAVLFDRYLGYYRETVIRKVGSLPDAEARMSRLPSGWSPVELLREMGRRTSAVLAEHSLEEPGAPGGRFDDEPPTLAWICFHVLQEYARHAGHLDIAVELAGGELGE